MGAIVTEWMRFETFFLDQLRKVGAIESQMALVTRARMNFEAIAGADSVGFFVDEIPPECRRPPIPSWCLIAKGIAIESNVALLDGLAENGHLKFETRPYWHRLARLHSLIEFAPKLFREIARTNGEWTPEFSLEILDLAFVAVSGAAPPGGESEWEEYCLEFPHDAICWVGRTQFVSKAARQLVQGLLVASALHQRGLLQEEQLRSVYDASFRALTATRGVFDLDLTSAGVIVDGLKRFDDKKKAGITTGLAAAQVGLVDPEGPWAEFCERPNPPRICNYINVFPVATKFTSELIRHKIWPEEAAFNAWETFGEYLDVTIGFEHFTMTGPLQEGERRREALVGTP